jgi:ABC-2 type transport system permease protein
MTTTATRASTTTRRASALSLGLSRTRLEVTAFFREKDALVFTFFFPIVLLGIFSVVFGGEDVDPGGGGPGGPAIDFAHYFLPGMVAAGLMLSSFQTLAISIAMEREDRTLKRLRGTPMPPLAYFLGKIGMVLVTSIAQIGLLLLVAALAFGVPLPTQAERWLTFAWVFVLGVAACTVLGVAFSSVPKSARSAGAVVAAPVIILQFISGVFFVFNELPSWLQSVASVFPLKWMAQGMRSVFLPAEFEADEVSGSWQHGPTVLVLLAWLVLGLILCVRTFRWQRRDDD